MKKPIIFISAIAILFTGCSTDIEVVEPNEHGEYKVETRSRSTTFDLCTQCELCDGSTVNLPWNTDVPGSVPEEVRYDVKESDGWRILYSTVEIIGYDHTVKVSIMPQACNQTTMPSSSSPYLRHSKQNCLIS